MQLFSVDATIYLKKKILSPQNMKKPASKVAHNPTRPRVLTPASICLCGTETVFHSVFFSSLKMSNFAGGI